MPRPSQRYDPHPDPMVDLGRRRRGGIIRFEIVERSAADMDAFIRHHLDQWNPPRQEHHAEETR